MDYENNLIFIPLILVCYLGLPGSYEQGLSKTLGYRLMF